MTADALLRFLRPWMLAFAIALGVLLYFGWMALPFGPTYEEEAISVVKFVQPWLIFTMLFVTFCKIDPRHLRLRRWHARHLAFQALTFTALAVLLHYFPTWSGRPVIEGAMLCLICPTATSCAVITGKLGGDIEGVTTYTMLINLLAALLIPAVVSVVAPHGGRDFVTSFAMILARSFPCSFVLSWPHGRCASGCRVCTKGCCNSRTSRSTSGPCV